MNPGQFLYDLEKTHFHITKDGYYNVNHIILPTIDWYNQTYLQQDDEYRKAFENIYIINDDNKIYKLTEEGFVESTVRELIARNHEGTTI
jgi:hypothetical protein